MRKLRILPFCFIIPFFACSNSSDCSKNKAPVIEKINVYPQEPTVDVWTYLTAVATDEEGDDLSYFWTCSDGFFWSSEVTVNPNQIFRSFPASGWRTHNALGQRPENSCESQRAIIFYEFESSKLTNIHTHKIMPGSLFGYNKRCSFGQLDSDTTAENPSVTYRIFSIDDKEIHRLTVYKSDLSSK